MKRTNKPRSEVPSWKDEVCTALDSLGGHAHLSDIYDWIDQHARRDLTTNRNPQAAVRNVLELHSSDSEAFGNGEDLFYSVDGLGKGRWGLRCRLSPMRETNDLLGSEKRERPEFKLVREREVWITERGRKLRDMSDGVCQICRLPGFEIEPHRRYAEVHYLRPLGEAHSGRDEWSNMIVVCPTHKAMLEFGAMPLGEVRSTIPEHSIARETIEYHTRQVIRNSTDAYGNEPLV
jgi:hypothetical protein